MTMPEQERERVAAVYSGMSDAELEKVAVSFGFASAWTRNVQCRSFPATEAAKSARIRLAKMDFMID